MQIERETFYEPKTIAQRVNEKIQQAEEKGEPIDYLSFVPDGEPTLDVNLGREIELLRVLGIQVAVITNASLLWRDDVRQDLQKAHWVSLKIDSVNPEVWRRINRPQGSLRFETILDGMLKFADTFKGELTTETMLVEGINDDGGEIERIAYFLGDLKPDKAYLAIPTRPPAKETVKAPSEQTLNIAYQILSKSVGCVEYLIGYEGNTFACTGSVEDDLVSIAAVHPMTDEAVHGLLRKARVGWEVVENLIANGDLTEVTYRGRKFYVRRPLKGTRSFGRRQG